MKTTDVPVLPPGLAQILQEFPGCVIAGSWPLAHLVDTEVDWEPGDIDLFMRLGKPPWAAGVEILQDAGWVFEDNNRQSYPHHESVVQTWNHDEVAWPLQVVFGVPKTPEEVWETFDLSICEVGIYWDSEVGDLVLATSDRYDGCEKSGPIRVIPKPPLDKGVLGRIKKYTERGFNPFWINGLGCMTITVKGEGFEGVTSGGTR